jgi:hypothetical protein
MQHTSLSSNCSLAAFGFLLDAVGTVSKECTGCIQLSRGNVSAVEIGASPTKYCAGVLASDSVNLSLATETEYAVFHSGGLWKRKGHYFKSAPTLA